MRIIDTSPLTKEEISERVFDAVNKIAINMPIEDLLQLYIEYEHDRIMSDFTDKEILEYIGEISAAREEVEEQ